MNKKQNVITLGCRLNTFESQAIEQNLKQQSIENDVIVVNTCTVTENAFKQSKQEIRKAKKQNPNKKIIVTGCAVESNFNDFMNMEEVYKVIKNKSKLQLSEYNLNNKTTVSKDSDFLEIPKLDNFGNKTRAFVQIQQGCNHRCSFCIIPQTRGKSVSLSKEDILSHVKTLVAKGYQEIVLTGVDISSWQREETFDKESKIGLLCKYLLQEEKGIKRLRLSSLDPALKDSELIKLLKEDERLMPHFHFSLQSLSNSVLKNMGRRHSQESALSLMEDLRQANKNVVFGADLITGFPRETDECFEDTLKAVESAFIPFLHVFPYSEREGTMALNFKQKVDVKTRRERAKILINKGNELKQNYFKSRLLKTESVLYEGSGKGYSAYYTPVNITNAEHLVKGKIYNVKVNSYNESTLQGEIV